MTKYLFPPIESVGIGPHTSLCTSCSFFLDRISPTGLNGARFIFPATHPSQNDSFVCFGKLIPVSNSSFTVFLTHCSLAVLSQTQSDGKVHPIAYASRSLNVHEKNYSATELETLGLSSEIACWPTCFVQNGYVRRPTRLLASHRTLLSTTATYLLPVPM